MVDASYWDPVPAVGAFSAVSSDWIEVDLLAADSLVVAGEEEAEEAEDHPSS